MFSLEADTAGLKRQILGLPRRSIDYTDSPRQRQATQPYKSLSRNHKGHGTQSFAPHC